MALSFPLRAGLFDPLFGSSALEALMADPFLVVQRPERRAYDYPMDIKETETSLSLIADAPGMLPEEVHVEFNDDTRVLTIRGQHSETKTEEQPAGGRSVHRSERVQRSFYRAFTLPKNVDPDAIEAQLERGVLTVRIPKKAPAGKPAPRKIQVTSHADGTHVDTKHIAGKEGAGKETNGTAGGSA